MSNVLDNSFAYVLIVHEHVCEIKGFCRLLKVNSDEADQPFGLDGLPCWKLGIAAVDEASDPQSFDTTLNLY